MSTLTLIHGGTGVGRRLQGAGAASALPRSGDDGDMVLAMLARARSLIDRVADRRRADNVVRNRVETRRQLAKLPARVRNDLLQPEQQPIPPSARSD
ncbi:hypothetical protein [Sinorhizobium saheli]|uniref:Uncharacterized protein n=1 Tax=Sinorhizobium saheli TaxID=36856 RepID=A0A178YFZ1_SINSA|nr:hypothetical protein [Sinorhizobium saheli]MQW90060.1 hypothetical protein [Sinorhizobium saheli]OAP45913.1 hypothetical protein ATB98_04460 [Sinorhizobium saheli]